MELIIDEIAVRLDRARGRGDTPGAIELGRGQVACLEAELRPFMRRCPHLCDADCLLEGCRHVHGPVEVWPGINVTGAATLFDVPLAFVDADDHLVVEVA
jgi:hypothetical protein